MVPTLLAFPGLAEASGGPAPKEGSTVAAGPLEPEAPPPRLTMAADASVGIRMATPDSDGVFLGGRFLAAGVDFFVGAAMLRDPSVGIGYLGGVSVQLVRGETRNPAYGVLVRHQFGVTGLSRRAQPFHWRVGAGANLYYQNSAATLGGGPGASFRLGWALGRPSRAHRVAVGVGPNVDYSSNGGFTTLLSLNVGWLWF